MAISALKFGTVAAEGPASAVLASGCGCEGLGSGAGVAAAADVVLVVNAAANSCEMNREHWV